MEQVQAPFAAGCGVDSSQNGGVGQADMGTSQIAQGDLLRYVGDMVEELQYMCQRTGCSTLQGLLALARAEAMVQQRAAAVSRRVA